jgi:lipopolysaccharide transport system ATP-binding protein
MLRSVLLDVRPPLMHTSADIPNAIEFQHVSKSFPRVTGQQLLRAHIVQWFGSGGKPERFYALKDDSFKMREGESLAIVGRTGAGKSTLLGLAAGLATPNQGRVIQRGRVGALVELGSGFQPDRTGAENLILNAALLGLSRRKTMEGDASFHEKCRHTLDSFLRSGKSLLFVSHSGANVREMCKRGIWLDHGALMMDGDASEAVDAYEGRAVMEQPD